MLRICSEEGGRGLDKCSKLAQKREGGVKKRPENAHMINERSLPGMDSVYLGMYSGCLEMDSWYFEVDSRYP